MFGLSGWIDALMHEQTANITRTNDAFMCHRNVFIAKQRATRSPTG